MLLADAATIALWARQYRVLSIFPNPESRSLHSPNKNQHRLYAGQRHVEVEWTVGPVPIADGLGKEVVLEYSTAGAIKSGSSFFTDSNGRHMLRRERDARPTWKLNVTEPVTGNYYPVTAAAYVEDEDAQLAVIVDRAQGTVDWSGYLGALELYNLYNPLPTRLNPPPLQARRPWRPASWSFCSTAAC